MRLTLNRPFLSLNELPITDLPDFTLIVGRNGAGKSHLLRALQNGSVTADVAPQAGQDVRLFDWSNLAPPEEAEFDVSSLRQEQVNVYNQVRSLIEQQPWGKQAIIASAINFFPGHLACDLSWLGSASIEVIAKNMKSGITQTPEQIKTLIAGAFKNAEENILRHLQQQQVNNLRSISELVKKPIPSLNYDDFFRTAKPSWGTAELFQQSFGRLFLAYRELYQMNRLAQLASAEGNEHAPALTNDEFLSRYGSPPWDFINDSLKAADLDFVIDAPPLFGAGPYKPRLHKKDIGADISFASLSSGEKVLMSFAFALYYASDSRQSIMRPKLLLLDEVDAPLHPSMCKNLLSTISNVLVNKQDLRVLMTTHSPTTVALAEEDALYVMRAAQPGIHKIGKDAAIRDLTDGVPTLSLSFDGRRQIFVESPRDVDVYQACYDVLKRKIDSPICLNFIATGVESAAGTHINTGCSVVERITEDLRQSGAAHTYGLLDWDGKNSNKEGIFVLCESKRNGLETVLFDPLLIVNALSRHVSISRVEINWPSRFTYLDLLTADEALLQDAVDWVQSKVLGRASMKDEKVRYVGNFSLNIDSEYLRMDDHKLEEAILENFSEFKAIQRRRTGELMKWIAQTIVPERLNHMPWDLLETFRLISMTT